MGKLDGKTAIVTGGTSGIGAATVRLFVENGARVLSADIQDEKGAAMAQALGENAAYSHADVSQESDVKALVDRALKEFGRLDCIFNNAGIPGPGGPIDTVPSDEFDATIAVHLRGVFLGIKYAAPVMKRQGAGSIINTGSVAGLHTGYAGHAYSAAKAAIIHFTRSVAMELGESGVRVNCICPGGIATPIFGVGLGLPREAADQTVDGIKSVLAALQPIRRAGLPEDIAPATMPALSTAMPSLSMVGSLVAKAGVKPRPDSARSPRQWG
jgi:NAD(P)-dependent dehydrogenase (short-subunit alcohol dehydrogenase family)